jgi:acyl-CoA thioesterase-2
LSPSALEQLVTTLAATPLGGDAFAADSPAEWDGERVFGGIVIAQSLAAAVQTVPAGLPVHSLHGYFLRPTPPGARSRIEVERVRDGRSFVTRTATTSIGGRPVFTLTCSFHAPEPGDEYQLGMGDDVPPPESLPPVDAPMPFDMVELGPTERREDGTYRSTRRVWFRIPEPVPAGFEPVILAYLSDMTGAAFRPHSLGVWGTHTDASLDHAVWFHRPARCDGWMLFDLHALVNTGGRATVRGELYGQDGVLRMSMAQEILIRPLDRPDPRTLPGWSVGAEAASLE